ncbi:MAG: energy-coupling factor transporter ATPase [Clostridiales Family XIII bacterium]|nr:energy-coupling factor transporter ATPase [Clostridiales Family XIII bacterium]
MPHDLLTAEALAAWTAETQGGVISARRDDSGGHVSPSIAHSNGSASPIPASVTRGNGSAAQSGACGLPPPELPEQSGGAGIRVEHLTHVYNKGLAYETMALDDISLDIRAGEFVGIIGHTGSGKSTLIQHLNGILKPGEGKIFIGGTDITDKKVKMSDIRKKVGLVFQYPEYQLFDETVLKDVSFGPKNLGLSDEEAAERAREALSMVGLDADEFAERSPFELSGGQKRRVAIAGVIAMQPETLILDEPTAGLDPKAHSDILEMVRSIKDRTGSTVILVSHNMDDIAEMSDRIFVMDSGKLVRSGAPGEVFADSAYLTNIGLGLPPATKLAGMLAARGIAFGRVMLTARDIEDALGGLIGGGK